MAIALESIKETDLHKTQIIPLWKYQQLGMLVWSDPTYDHKIQNVSTLLTPDGQKYLALYTINNVLHRGYVTPETVGELEDRDFREFFFNDEAGGIWLDEKGGDDFLVVGTGDIRHFGAAYATAYFFKLNTSAENALVITCTDDYCWKLYHTEAVIDQTITPIEID